MVERYTQRHDLHLLVRDAVHRHKCFAFGDVMCCYRSSSAYSWDKGPIREDDKWALFSFIKDLLSYYLDCIIFCES